MKITKAKIGNPVLMPLVGARVEAGFPSPAEDFREGTLDLNDLLISHPNATFYVRAAGDSMTNAGIFAGDLLVVNRALDASHGDIVVAVVNGEFTLKRLYMRNSNTKLIAENDQFPDIEFAEGEQLEVWGVVTGCVKQFK